MPDTVTVTVRRRVLAFILIYLVVLAVLVGGYLGGWWVREELVTAQSETTQTTTFRLLGKAHADRCVRSCCTVHR